MTLRSQRLAHMHFNMINDEDQPKLMDLMLDKLSFLLYIYIYICYFLLLSNQTTTILAISIQAFDLVLQHSSASENRENKEKE